MKRDMDLIRTMLLKVEEHEHGYAPNLEIEGYTQEQIGYHATLLHEAGLVHAIDLSSMSDESPNAQIESLTWAGHEFLDAARENTTWNKAKETIGKIGGATLQIWIAVLTSYIQKQLGL